VVAIVIVTSKDNVSGVAIVDVKFSVGTFE
jgi:hypothetical protein